jgi:formylmethanofuran dehydrogenase subunit C
VLQIREFETENEKMKKEVISLKDFRNNLIEKHAQEIKSIQESARRAIERLKDS